MAHIRPRICVFTQTIDFSSTNYTVGTPVQLNTPASTVLHWQIQDQSGQVFDFSLGPNSGSLTKEFTMNQGGGEFSHLISANASIWLTAQSPTGGSGSVVNQGIMVINGYQ